MTKKRQSSIGKKIWSRWASISLFVFSLFILTTQITWAKPVTMHIMEGYLPPLWCVFWFAIALPFWLLSFLRVQKIAQKPETRLLLGLCGAFVFVLSALKMPSVTGSSSHPTGMGLGAILFGPTTMSLIGTIVLLFQALLIAHGGLTTLGANAFSMAIVGPFIAFILWHTLKDRLPQQIVVFLAAALADLATYGVTSIQLALAYPDAVGGFWPALLKFSTIFALTQLPLAISEGILTVLIFNALQNDAAVDLQLLGVSS